MAVPYTFGNATTSIPLSQLDTNFATAITIGNTAVYLGNTTTSFGNVTLTNVTISSGNATVTKITAPTHDAGSGNALTLQSNSTTGLYIDTSQNVGIGTSSPGSTLDVNGTIVARCPAGGTGLLMRGRSSDNLSQILGYDNGVTTLYGQIQFASTGGGVTTLISNGATGYTNFYTNGSERMRIDSSGNVGIGTSSPTSFGGRNLQINDPSNGYAGLLVSSGTYTFEALMSQTNGVTSVGMRSNHPLALVTNDTERMRIDTSGNVGIGTSSPIGKLDIATSAGRMFFSYVSSANQISSVNTANNAYVDLGLWANNTLFYTGGSERARIDSSGNLLVGTTSAVVGATGGSVQAVGSSTNRGYMVIGRTTAQTSGVVGSVQGLNGSNQIASMDFASNGANNSGLIQMYTWSAGSIVQGPYLNTGGTSWTTASDENLKDIIEPITNGLTKVASLRSVIGKFKTDAEGTRRAFLIAQDVQKVLPEAVGKDREGNLGLNYTDVIPLLVSAIQELKAELDALKGTK